jgi:acetoin utilization deacetylase AcuC-like enzyme
VAGATPLVIVSTGPEREHAAPGHPERPDRVAAILDRIAADPLLAARPRGPAVAVDTATIALAHTEEHIAEVRSLAEGGGGWIDGDTYCTGASFEAARRSAGAAAAATATVLDGRATHAFSVSRPPGHHATADTAMGFCLFNNAAIAIRLARRRGARRVAVVDIDVHHGNGTEAIFWEEPEVLYTSIHQWPLYPGTGPASARGGAQAEGSTLNLPVAPGTTGDEWLQQFDATLLPAVRVHRPDLIVVSAGYDAHEADPLASLRLTAATYASVAERIDSYCAERGIGSVWLLEGGYDLPALADSVAATLHTLLGRSPLGASAV